MDVCVCVEQCLRPSTSNTMVLYCCEYGMRIAYCIHAAKIQFVGKLVVVFHFKRSKRIFSMNFVWKKNVWAHVFAQLHECHQYATLRMVHWNENKPSKNKKKKKLNEITTLFGTCSFSLTCDLSNINVGTCLVGQCGIWLKFNFFKMKKITHVSLRSGQKNKTIKLTIQTAANTKRN